LNGMQRRVFTVDDLRDIAERDLIPLEVVERDFLLLSIAGQLAEKLPGILCFKGGFVLRHVHGQVRLSKDIDATRIHPPRHKVDTAEVSRIIGQSGRDMFRLKVGLPGTDTESSLDFDRVVYEGPLGGHGQVAVELSFRYEVILDPQTAMIGTPYYEPFELLVLQPAEIVAEKLRALAQRLRPTDLADIAFLLVTRNFEFERELMRRLVKAKFTLVAEGDHQGRVERNITRLERDYGRVVAQLAPDALEYPDAARAVRSRLGEWFT
jgi:predicted nucleotidyltransferase component of viral defense system